MSPVVHLVAYDVRQPGRLQRVTKAVKAWKAAGQKSVAECWVTPAQREALGRRLEALTRPDEDRLAILRLDPRQKVMMFGVASRPAAPVFIVT